MKIIVMSLGGSLIAPDQIDIKFLKSFREVILKFVKKGNKVIIICGGGDTARNYQRAAKKIFSSVSTKDLDWMGIAATRINAELVSSIFGNMAYENVVLDPAKKVKTNKKIIVGGGYKPGRSSDMASVILAKTYGAGTVINLSNISYVYDKDPSKFKDAKVKKKMNWSEFQKLVGDKWVPGAHLPFDPVATKLAAKEKMTLYVAKGSNLPNLEKILQGKAFVGTKIS